MRTIKGPGEYELEVKKSRFLCSLARVGTEEEARAFIQQQRRLHHDARHNCSAYVLGEDGQAQRSSDDGEPAGTAGVPMLEVLRRNELTDVVAVVTRYFGGVLLGAGGLIRAYGSAVSEALEQVGLVERRPVRIVTTRVEHALAGRLENEIRASRYHLAGVGYTDRVCLEVHVPETELSAFELWLAEVTGGAAVPERGGTTTVQVDV